MKKIIGFIKKYFFYIIISLFIFIIIFITCFLGDTKEVMAQVEEKIEDKPIKTTFKVDIKGAVNIPGVYELEENSRVIDALNKAGGVLDTADTSLINLSKKIKDEMTIIIYTKDEIVAYNEGKIKTEYVYIEVNNCPDQVNNACINEYTPSTENSNAETKSLININSASIDELQNLSGIGESKATSIIEYRNTTKFNVIEDIKNVKGIGDSLFEKIKDSITI